MKDLKLQCTSCNGTEFEDHKYGLKCSFCGTVYEKKIQSQNGRTLYGYTGTSSNPVFAHGMYSGSIMIPYAGTSSSSVYKG